MMVSVGLVFTVKMPVEIEQILKWSSLSYVNKIQNEFVELTESL